MFEKSSAIPAGVQEARANKQKELLTHSRMSCFRSCPRKHYLRYELGLTAETDDMPRKFGTAFHALLEARDKGTIETTDLSSLDEYDRAAVIEMFSAHCAYMQKGEDNLEVVAAELEFDIPLKNPETGYSSSIYRLAGKIDRIVKLADGRLALMEYKTTSRDFSPGAEYWQRLHLDQQLSIYVIAARELGYDVETILYDVTRRPALRPYKATPAEARKYTKDGRLYANQREEDESPEDFGKRLENDIDERPEHYFARIEIARLEADLDECRAELWDQSQALREAQRAGRWYRNPNNCFATFTCEFVPICQMSALDVITPAGFVRQLSVHPELSVAAE